MSEESEKIEQLESEGILSLFDWAGASVFTRVGQDYDEAAGHGQQVVGMLSYTYLRDRLDRATSCGRFALPDDAAPDSGIDMLRDGITPDDFARMPRFEPGAIVRRDLNGSPAWALGDCRWVLQSFDYGRVDHIYWPEKSDTKAQVSRQPFEGIDTPLFEAEEFGLESVPVVTIDSFGGDTFVLAHAFNRETGSYEMYFGRSRPQEHRSDPSWYWRRRVVSGGPGNTGGIRRPDQPVLPGAPPTPIAPDVDVRLRSRDADGVADGTGD